MPDEKTPKTEVSPGSVTKYFVKNGLRWRWQGYATTHDGMSKSRSQRLGGGGFATKKEAQAAMLDAFYEIRKFGLPGTPQVQEDLLCFNPLSLMWLESLDLANSTLAGYRKIIRNHIAPYLGEELVSEVTTEDLNKLYKRLLTGGRNDSKAPGGPLKSNTVHKCHQVLRSMLDFAVVQELIAENVARSPKVRMPTARSIRSQKEELQVWTLGQTKNFLRWNEEVDCDDLNVLWRVYAMTGVRRGEGIALQWKDIDFEKSKIKVIRASDSAKARATKRTKTYRQRSLEIDPELLGYLESHRGDRAQMGPEYVSASAFVFGTINNELRGPNDVTRRFSRAVLRAQAFFGKEELPWVTLHGLRHGHATHLLEDGRHPKVVQERLGHTNIQTTLDIYSHVSPTLQKDAVSGLWATWKALP